MSLDNNEIQARSGSGSNSLFLNYYGGDIDLLGFSNSTGNLIVDDGGLYYQNSNNNVGIGTNNPMADLHLDGSTGERIRLSSPGGNGFIAFRDANQQEAVIENFDNDLNLISRLGDVKLRAQGASGTFEVFTGGLQRMTVLPNGFVGIGTIFPADPLHVDGDARFVDGKILLEQVGEGFNIDLRADGNLAFEVNGVQGDNTFVINDNNSRVGIGIENPDEKLHVTGNIRCEGDLLLGSIEALRDGGIATIETNSDFDPDTHLEHDMGASNEAWDEIYADNFNNVSDIRLKDNITDLPYGLDEIQQIETIRYKLKDDPFEEEKIGFSAQNLLTLIPEMVVTEQTFADAEGNTWTEPAEYYAVTHDMLLPVLVNGIKEMVDEIESLKAKVNELQLLLDNQQE